MPRLSFSTPLNSRRADDTTSISSHNSTESTSVAPASRQVHHMQMEAVSTTETIDLLNMTTTVLQHNVPADDWVNVDELSSHIQSHSIHNNQDQIEQAEEDSFEFTTIERPDSEQSLKQCDNTETTVKPTTNTETTIKPTTNTETTNNEHTEAATTPHHVEQEQGQNLYNLLTATIMRNLTPYRNNQVSTSTMLNACFILSVAAISVYNAVK